MSIISQLPQWLDGMSKTAPELRPILLACTFMSANKPQLLPSLVTYTLTSSLPNPCSPASEGTLESQALFIRRLREGIYKGSVLCGGPYGINALGAINASLHQDLIQAVNSLGPIRTPENALSNEEYQKRGEELFRLIYERHTELVLEKIGNSSQDLVQSILRDTYGKVLSDTTVLDLKETELILVASLVPLNVPPQLKSHIHGARNVGVPMDQVQEVVEVIGEVVKWIKSNTEKSSL